MDKADENILRQVAWNYFNMKEWESDVETVRFYINSTPEEQKNIKLDELQQAMLGAYDETCYITFMALR